MAAATFTHDAQRIERVLVLGTGYTGEQVVKRAREAGLLVTAQLRAPERVAALERLGAQVLLMPELDAGLTAHVTQSTHVVIAFPPDGATDQRIAPLLSAAGAITYVSSTAVYGELRGRIDDATPLPEPSDSTRPRLLAEQAYRQLGATILRCPAIYGPERGLHLRVLRGQYALPGDGSGMLSRVHVEDLASFILASPRAPGETFVVGDLEPAAHLTVVSWICATYALPFPVRVERGVSHRTLRADRAIDSARARHRLGVTLRYPTFREGMARIALGGFTQQASQRAQS